MDQNKNKSHGTENASVAEGKASKGFFSELRLFFKPHMRLIFTLLTALAVTLFMEITNRRSLFSAFAFAFAKPHFFLLNFVIVFFSMSITLLLKKRKVWLLFISAVWAAFGITDFIMRSNRVTPFAAVDIALLESVWSILPQYLGIWQIIIIIAAILAAIAIIVILLVKVKKEAVDFKTAACSVAVSALLLFGMTSVYHGVGLVPEHFGNLPDAYRDYGFAYCYSIGVFDTGIDKPDNYSKESVGEILSSIGASPNQSEKSKPNIIFVQLESFFDVNYLKDVTYSEEPLPNFTALKREYSNGFLRVPSIGSGTANTEFEILTGMSLDYFGSTEYPYKTIMQDSTCETIAYNLKEQGYAAHAVHNHSGNFYDRNLVFSNMGFDTFNSLEFLQDVEENPIGWAKDSILKDAVLDALDSTETQDFVYAITVQSHGKYPTQPLGNEEPIEVSAPLEEGRRVALQYFVNQLHETDKFIGELIDELEGRSEPFILCLFGDHLPTLNLTAEDITNGNLFDTEYVIWSNLGYKREIKDLYAYQLTAHVMGKAGFSNGIFTKLHQNYADKENYYEALEMLEFDVLYGDYGAYGGKQKYQPTEIQMGIHDITIKGVLVTDGTLIVSGNNFTPFSTIEIGGKRMETEFVNKYRIKTVLEEPEDPSELPGDIVIVQVTKNGEDIWRVPYN